MQPNQIFMIEEQALLRLGFCVSVREENTLVCCEGSTREDDAVHVLRPDLAPVGAKPRRAPGFTGKSKFPLTAAVSAFLLSFLSQLHLRSFCNSQLWNLFKQLTPIQPSIQASGEGVGGSCGETQSRMGMWLASFSQ